MRRLGVIIFGAGIFDFHSDLNNPSFVSSAREFKKTIAETKIATECETETLDLYNKPLSVSETHDKVLDFVGKEFDDIIVYYCGHGDVGLREGDYGVFLRKSNRERRHTLINVPTLIKSVKRAAYRKRVYFIIDACYAGSAVGEMETMDVGGAETLISRRLLETVHDNGRGTAVLAASSRFGVALAKSEDRLTLFTGAFIRCLKEGVVQKKEVQALSWLDVKDEVVRIIQDRLGADAPIPTLMSYSDSASDITRTPFFMNRAFVPNIDGGKDGRWINLDDRVTEHLYWKSISEDSPSFVLEDFLGKFPNGIFSKPARAFLLKQISRLDEKGLADYLVDHPSSGIIETVALHLADLTWRRILELKDVAEYERFIQRFPKSPKAAEARLQIDRLKRTPPSGKLTAEDKPKASDAADDLIGADIKAAPAAHDVLSIISPVAHAAEQPSTADKSHEGISRFVYRGGVLITAAVVVVAAIMIGIYYDRTTEIERSTRELNAAGSDIAQLQSFVDWCKATTCPVLESATGRLERMRVAEATAREQKFRTDLAAAGDDLDKLRMIVNECQKVSCAVLSDANRKLAAAEAAARDQQFRRELAAAGDDVEKLKKLLSDCQKTSCAALSDVSRRLVAAQTVAEATAREQKFRTDLAAAGDDLDKLRMIVNECQKVSCAVLSDANRKLAAAETAARDQQFRRELAAAGDDIDKLRKIVAGCQRAFCTALTEARNRLTAAEAIAEAATREQQFRNDLIVAGSDLDKLRRIVSECQKVACAVLYDATRRLAEAQATAALAAREQRFRNDLAEVGNDIEKLTRIVGECQKVSCSALQEATNRLNKAKEQRPPLQFTLNLNYDMYGGDIEFRGDDGSMVKFIKTDSATCLARCRSTHECVAFVFDKWNSACYLKRQLSMLTQTPRSDASLRSDQKPLFETAKPHTCPYPNSSMRGNSIRVFRAQSVEFCRRECEGESKCVAYTFKKREGECTFFNSVLDRTKSDPAADSGERTQNQNPC
ncbi:MAG: PAN domain-containing protein [Bradyrhizobium sp.]